MRVSSSEREPAADAVSDGCDDLRVGVTEDHGPPGADIIDVALAVGVEEVGSGRTLEEDGVSAHAAEGPHRGVHTAWDVTLGGGEEVMGAGHGCILRSGVSKSRA
jgi:hypothetical protein